MGTVRWGRWGAALGLGALWWWGMLRLALSPDAGPVEAAIAAGGWGLSLLPVHCVPKRSRGSSRASGSAAPCPPTPPSVTASAVTRASPPRRSGGGSGPS
ncbi:hypothetical protein [Streptomyces spongiae]|uniref:Uncharacterized protein n=1 Tax=Streptomyces spongiae TaxID=565072 RepID=A0A5N8XUH1_9ACTN|nr:hypothetical protein [Streptomyces spongiae]MPY63040.1 hypothetical protein [Streptomyces spongiae]